MIENSPKIFKFKNKEFTFGKKSHLMGILNVTPDSFSDGNTFLNIEKAFDHALEMHNCGADIIDIGGESTRPGAAKISLEEEIKRVIPILIKIKSHNSDIVISIDTTKSALAEIALSEGADIINDISGLTYDPEIANIAAKYNAGLILMHMRGTPKNMNSLKSYDNLIVEISSFLNNASDQAIERGISPNSLMIDPGIGFAKDSVQNIEIIKHIDLLMDLKYPVLVGPSRKKFIGEIINESDASKRNWGTAAVIAWLATKHIPFIRVHEVKEMQQVIDVITNFTETSKD